MNLILCFYRVEAEGSEKQKNIYSSECMNITSTIKETKSIISQWKKEGLSIGFVPTMGYLHIGHLSLIEQARKQNDKVVVSIFINPTQFDSKEDFEKYPSNLEQDASKCKEAGTDLIFAPSAEEMYPDALYTFVDMIYLTEELCGKSRQGHFSGVCTVVSKLFNIVTPDRAYFGKKDAQQVAVIKKMVHDLNFNVEIVPCEIKREEDGLACSSRNANLSQNERAAARILSVSLKKALSMLEEGERSAHVIISKIREIIESEPLSNIDYVEIVDSETLKPIEQINGPILVAVAVFIGSTRLIDNFSYDQGTGDRE